MFRSMAMALSLGLGLAMLPLAAQAIPKVGEAAPAFALPTTHGATLSLGSLRGKPVYVNFFASWCGPCNDEAPSIEHLYERYAKRGLTIVGINELESAQQAQAFVAKYHLRYAAVVDADGGTGKAYGAIGLPVHIFITRAGIVKTYRLGEMDPSEIESAIKGIL